MSLSPLNRIPKSTPKKTLIQSFKALKTHQKILVGACGVGLVSALSYLTSSAVRRVVAYQKHRNLEKAFATSLQGEFDNLKKTNSPLSQDGGFACQMKLKNTDISTLEDIIEDATCNEDIRKLAVHQLIEHVKEGKSKEALEATVKICASASLTTPPKAGTKNGAVSLMPHFITELAGIEKKVPFSDEQVKTFHQVWLDVRDSEHFNLDKYFVMNLLDEQYLTHESLNEIMKQHFSYLCYEVEGDLSDKKTKSFDLTKLKEMLKIPKTGPSWQSSLEVLKKVCEKCDKLPEFRWHILQIRWHILQICTDLKNDLLKENQTSVLSWNDEETKRFCSQVLLLLTPNPSEEELKFAWDFLKGLHRNLAETNLAETRNVYQDLDSLTDLPIDNSPFLSLYKIIYAAKTYATRFGSHLCYDALDPGKGTNNLPVWKCLLKAFRDYTPPQTCAQQLWAWFKSTKETDKGRAKKLELLAAFLTLPPEHTQPLFFFKNPFDEAFELLEKQKQPFHSWTHLFWLCVKSCKAPKDVDRLTNILLNLLQRQEKQNYFIFLDPNISEEEKGKTVNKEIFSLLEQMTVPAAEKQKGVIITLLSFLTGIDYSLQADAVKELTKYRLTNEHLLELKNLFQRSFVSIEEKGPDYQDQLKPVLQACLRLFMKKDLKTALEQLKQLLGEGLWHQHIAIDVILESSKAYSALSTELQGLVSNSSYDGLRNKCIQAMGEFGGDREAEYLLQCLEKEKHASVRIRLTEAIDNCLNRPKK